MIKLKTKGKEILKLYLPRIGREMELFSIRERVDSGIATFSLAPPCPQQIWEWHDYWMHSCCWRWRDRVHPLLQLPFLISLPKTLFLIQDLFNSGLQWTRLSAGRECQAALLPLPSAVSSNMVMDGIRPESKRAWTKWMSPFFGQFLPYLYGPTFFAHKYLVIFTLLCSIEREARKNPNLFCFVYFSETF